MRQITMIISLVLISGIASAADPVSVFRKFTAVSTESRQQNDPVYGPGAFYGGCFAKFDENLGDVADLAGCNQNFVAFGCDGRLGSKTEASNKYSLAQLALVTGYTAKVLINPNKKINGMCFADFVQVNGN